MSMQVFIKQFDTESKEVVTEGFVQEIKDFWVMLTKNEATIPHIPLREPKDGFVSNETVVNLEKLKEELTYIEAYSPAFFDSYALPYLKHLDTVYERFSAVLLKDFDRNIRHVASLLEAEKLADVFISPIKDDTFMDLMTTNKSFFDPKSRHRGPTMQPFTRLYRRIPDYKECGMVMVGVIKNLNEVRMDKIQQSEKILNIKLTQLIERHKSGDELPEDNRESLVQMVKYLLACLDFYAYTRYQIEAFANSFKEIDEQSRSMLKSK